ncbi:hypothetical protein LC608_27215 [Nostoc sp. XA010]|uniref:hypothetical protein n=1 Tax=Nostoc sp. XA010 TaxID=2780407 RepID=UPI001E4559A1|nr:hypothetical protein [Nostoc sp. XA010]MCC5660604.1 hypothetical protein [Nostoc sp. XA010]
MFVSEVILVNVMNRYSGSPPFLAVEGFHLLELEEGVVRWERRSLSSSFGCRLYQFL